ncbi:MAG: putative addiction module component (TIGR02574 family) [Verrucomicrobiales bacterium]|jgi:putative addiction module component (TIGR02574 family)
MNGMNPTLSSIKTEALRLPIDERATLVSDLIRSLDGDEASIEGIDAAWDVEIARRVDEIKGGMVEGISAEEVHVRLRKAVSP